MLVVVRSGGSEWKKRELVNARRFMMLGLGVMLIGIRAAPLNGNVTDQLATRGW
jgi:hypothetical protein